MMLYGPEPLEFIRKEMRMKGISNELLAKLCQDEENKKPRTLYARINGERMLTVEQCEDILLALKMSRNRRVHWLKHWKETLAFYKLDKTGVAPKIVRKWLKTKNS